jgi:hypothetical protein
MFVYYRMCSLTRAYVLLRIPWAGGCDSGHTQHHQNVFSYYIDVHTHTLSHTHTQVVVTVGTHSTVTLVLRPLLGIPKIAHKARVH